MQVVLFLCLCLLSIAAAKPAPPEINMANYPNMEFAGSVMRGNRTSDYIISEKLLDYHVARLVCESLGSGNHLVQISDETENEHVYSLLTSGGHTSVWTSGNDLVKNGCYIWAMGSGIALEPFTFTDWVNGVAPNNPDCGCVSIKSTKTGNCDSSCIGEYKWHEEDCQIKKKFLCESA